MATYLVTLVDPTGEFEDESFECDDDEFVLDAAEDAGIEIPYSCRAGACTTCAGKVQVGEVMHGDTFLSDNQVIKGFFLPCVGCPSSDMTLLTDQEDDVYHNK